MTLGILILFNFGKSNQKTFGAFWSEGSKSSPFELFSISGVATDHKFDLFYGNKTRSGAFGLHLNHSSDNGNNFWNLSYPLGGNYWSDWTTPDMKFGPNQDQLGADGIVDNPRDIDNGTNKDFYPFTTPNGWENITSPGPVHNIDTNEYFNQIQAAIDDADTQNGHTIEVSNGTYVENIVINKSLWTNYLGLCP